MRQKNFSQQVSDRVMEVLKTPTIKDLVVVLEVNEGTYRSWLSRDSLDLRVIVAKCNGFDLNYIFTGKKMSSKMSSKMSPNLSSNLSSNSENTPGLPFNMDSECDNCQKAITKYFELSDYLKAKEAENKALNREIGKLETRLEDLGYDSSGNKINQADSA